MNDNFTKPLTAGRRSIQARANYIRNAVLSGIIIGLTPKEIFEEIGENKTTLNHVKNIFDMIKANDMHGE